MVAIDKELFLLLNGLHAPWADSVMWWISSKFIWMPLYAWMLYVLYRRYPGQAFIVIVLTIVVCVVTTDQMASGLFKGWVERLRPSHEPSLSGLVHLVTSPDGDVYRGGRFGFYSSHASNLAGVVTLFVLWIRPSRRVTVLLSLWVLLVGYSRIYLGVHYPGDILVGLASGILIGSIFHRLSCATGYLQQASRG